jgi:hypothetical protein
LVSENGFYDIYDLTDAKGIAITVMSGGKLLRKIVIGKSTSASNQSYVRIDDKKEIYLASGIAKIDFTRSVSDLRDKKIFDVKSADIKSFSISYAGKNFLFQPNPDKDKDRDNLDKTDDADDPDEAKNDPPKWICKGYENITLRDSSIDSLLNIFSPLKAGEFPENTAKENLRNKVCSVNIECDGKNIELFIYDKKVQGMNLASSPESDYVFTLGSWQVNRLFIKDLSGLSVKK